MSFSLLVWPNYREYLALVDSLFSLLGAHELLNDALMAFGCVFVARDHLAYQRDLLLYAVRP
mgnify:CR=1 FL=1